MWRLNRYVYVCIYTEWIATNETRSLPWIFFPARVLCKLHKYIYISRCALPLVHRFPMTSGEQKNAQWIHESQQESTRRITIASQVHSRRGGNVLCILSIFFFYSIFFLSLIKRRKKKNISSSFAFFLLHHSLFILLSQCVVIWMPPRHISTHEFIKERQRIIKWREFILKKIKK